MKQEFIVSFKIGFDTDTNGQWTKERVSDYVAEKFVNEDDGVGVDSFERGHISQLPDKPTRPSECPTCGGTSSFCPYKNEQQY
jgi:hypothetical protein